jgi:hypothetical protein
MIRLAFALCALCAFTAPTQAQTAASSGTVALTPEQREAALETAAVHARDESLQNGATDRRVHGEVGVEVGSRGERAAYGTLVAPIGQNGAAAISYGTGQGPRWHGRRGRFHGSSVSAAYENDTAPAPVPGSADGENFNPD